MDIRDFQSDLNFRRASGSGRLLQRHEIKPFMKNQCDALDLCKKLSKIGIYCDVAAFGSSEFNQNLCEASSVRQGFLQNKNFHDGSEDVSSVFLHNNNFHGVSSTGDMRFLGLQDSYDSNGFEEMMALKNHRDFLLDDINQPIKRPSPCLKGSLMCEGNRVSRNLAAMEVSGHLGATFPEDSLIRQGSYGRMNLNSTSGLPTRLVSMVKIYGSVNLMAKDQIGCRALQKEVEEGTFEAKFICVEIIDHVTELSMDRFGNYLVQKLLDVSDEEQRTILVSVLTSKPMELLQICLNTYGTRVVQKMIETVTTKEQIEMVKSSLKPGFLALVKDLNGNYVLKSCLQFLGPTDNEFLLEAGTKYFDKIATHPYGCCVLQCCLANSVGPQHEILVAEILQDSLHLSQDQFWNYVVQSLIDHQVSASKVHVQFRKHYAELATQKFSSHVIEKCLKNYPESRAEIVRELLSVPHFEQLLQDPYANYVINTALSVTKGGVRARLEEEVYRFRKLQSIPYCKKIFAKTILKK